MRFDFKSLFFWYLIYYFLVDGGLHKFILTGTMDPISVIDTAFSLSSLLIFFLFWFISYTTLYKYYPKRQWLLIVLGLMLSYIVPVLLRYLVEQKLFLILFGFTNYPEHVKIESYLFDHYFFAIRYIPAGVIYYFFRNSIFAQHREKELTIENQKMRLSLLYGQINPHFLLNSLNNIQSLAYLKSEKTIGALEHLSDILKYKLYQDKKWISVKEEMEMIEKYIALERLRYDYAFELDISLDDAVHSKTIPQYLLLPLFENAFKHADLRDQKNPFTLRIENRKEGILIQSSNAIGMQSKDKTGGIGLENLRKRLSLLYNSDYSFKVNRDGGIFSIKISLPHQ